MSQSQTTYQPVSPLGKDKEQQQPRDIKKDRQPALTSLTR